MFQYLLFTFSMVSFSWPRGTNFSSVGSSWKLDFTFRRNRNEIHWPTLHHLSSVLGMMRIEEYTWTQSRKQPLRRGTTIQPVLYDQHEAVTSIQPAWFTVFWGLFFHWFFASWLCSQVLPLKNTSQMVSRKIEFYYVYAIILLSQMIFIKSLFIWTQNWRHLGQTVTNKFWNWSALSYKRVCFILTKCALFKQI